MLLSSVRCGFKHFNRFFLRLWCTPLQINRKFDEQTHTRQIWENFQNSTKTSNSLGFCNWKYLTNLVVWFSYENGIPEMHLLLMNINCCIKCGFRSGSIIYKAIANFFTRIEIACKQCGHFFYKYFTDFNPLIRKMKEWIKLREKGKNIAEKRWEFDENDKSMQKKWTDEMRGWQQESQCANSAKMIKFYVQYKYCRNKMTPKPTLTTHSSQIKEKKIMFKLKSNESTDISIFMETVTTRQFEQTHTERTHMNK